MLFSKRNLIRNVTTGRVWLFAICVLGLQACAVPSYNSTRTDSTPPSVYLLSEQVEAKAVFDQQSGLIELLTSALTTHPAILAAEADRRAAAAEVRIAGALMDPQLSFTQGLNDADRQTLALEQRLPLFGQRGLAAERSEQMQRAVAAKWQQVRSEVARDVLKTYAEYAYIGTAGKIMAQQVALLNQMLDVSRMRYSTGSGTQADLLRMESEKEQLVNQQVSLSAMLPVARARLNAALGRPPGSPLPAPHLQQLPMRFDENSPLVTQVFDSSQSPDGSQPANSPQLTNSPQLLNSPQLQQLQYELAAAEAAQRLASRAGLPDLMIGVEQMRNGEMGTSETNLMLGINLPIWRGRYEAQKLQAESLHQAVGERMRDRQQMLEAEVRMALFSLDEANRNYTLYTESLVPRGEQAFKVTLSSYRSGAATFADLIASQREWLTFELNRERSLADALLWQGELMALLGVDSVLSTREEIQ